MIIIKQPNLTINGKARLSANVVVDGQTRNIWFEVDERYGQYLYWERSDAFLIGLLNWAMRNQHDITCEAPVSEELLYQITTYLIPSLANHSKKLYATRILAPINTSSLKNAGAVGTGISCGIDSFHVLAKQSNSPYPHLNLTHLAFNNVGSHGIGRRAKELFDGRRKLVEDFAKEYGYELVISDSNFAEVFPQNHLLTHTYSSTFAIYALQKLWSVYFYASAHDFSAFSLKDNEKYDTSYYDLLLLDALSTKTLRIYSEGAAQTRLEKVRVISEYEPSYRYMNVCVADVKNCGRCAKCVRTLLELDALGKLDLYSSVFDVAEYHYDETFYLLELLRGIVGKQDFYIELYPYLKHKLSYSIYAKHYVLQCYRFVRRCFGLILRRAGLLR